MDYFSGFFLSISFEIFPVINIAYVKIVLGSFIRRPQDDSYHLFPQE